MNERIKLLAEQAAQQHGHTIKFSSEIAETLNSFAELIVRECVMCMYRRGVEGFGMLEERMLKEHFGVE